jgi:hypothetical protein
LHARVGERKSERETTSTGEDESDVEVSPRGRGVRDLAVKGTARSGQAYDGTVDLNQASVASVLPEVHPKLVGLCPLLCEQK